MLTVSGLDELIAALGRVPARLEQANVDGLSVGGELAAAETRRLLNQRTHSRGTPTPSAPGQPPARIGGALAGSVKVTRPQQVAPLVHQVRVSSGLAYSLIQERGGVAGRGHRSRLPARPYVKPAIMTVAPQAVRALAEAWMRALLG